MQTKKHSKLSVFSYSFNDKILKIKKRTIGSHCFTVVEGDQTYKNHFKKGSGSYNYTVVGGSGFEPLKTKVDGFTVRCIWPLCNPPKMELVVGIEPTTV